MAAVSPPYSGAKAARLDVEVLDNIGNEDLPGAALQHVGQFKAVEENGGCRSVRRVDGTGSPSPARSREPYA